MDKMTREKLKMAARKKINIEKKIVCPKDNFYPQRMCIALGEEKQEKLQTYYIRHIESEILI